MTPPTLKPQASVTDADAVEPAADDTAEVAAPRRRTALMEARIARRRTVGRTATTEGDEAEPSQAVRTEGVRASRTAGASSRTGPRALQRAARVSSKGDAASEEALSQPALAVEAAPAVIPEGVRASRTAGASSRTGPRALQRAARVSSQGDAASEEATPQPELAVEAPPAVIPEGVRASRTAGASSRTSARATQRAARLNTKPEPEAAEVTDLAQPEPIPTPPPPLLELVAEAPQPPAQPVAEEPSPAVTDAPSDDEEDAPGQRRRNPRAEKRAARAARAETSTDASHYVVAPTAQPAQMRTRHYGVIAMFILFVVVPTLSYSWYLWTKAADQYESDVGFGSRTEEAGSTFDFLGALGGTTQSGSKDMDILNQFIISQELVAKVDAVVDLKAIYGKATGDPLNAFHPDGTIEDLVKFWQRMVLINYDNGTGLMNLRVFAFDPVDAQKIAQVVLVESTKIINDLSQTAQADTTRYSQDVLRATEAKLAEARLAVLDFQVRNRIVDPSNAIANQLSVVSTLNQQMAGAQIELDMLAGTVPATDPRIAQLNRRIEVIGNRITEEQSKVGANTDAPGFANLMAEFERLKVDQDFAQQAYLSALAAHDQALTDAQHKTRYLATYVTPTMAEASTAPNRPLSAFLVAVIGFLLWAVTVLIYYALRDRR